MAQEQPQLAFKSGLDLRRGEYRIIRCDGTEELKQQKPTIRAIEQAIGASMLDTVILTHRNRIPELVMMVDDTGMCDGKPVNPKATALYREVCRPGTLHSIHGDVALVIDGDFGG